MLRKSQARRAEKQYEKEAITPRKNQFARTEAYDSGIISPEKDKLVDEHAREGYERSTARRVGVPPERIRPRKKAA